MSQYEKQQELLLQLKVENQQLLKFKKLNTLMQETLDNITLKKVEHSPFSPLFELMHQEFNAEEQIIVVLDDKETSFSILDTTTSQLKNQTAPLELENAPDGTLQHVFSQSSVFFNVSLSSKWPAIFSTLLPDITSALIQPVRIAQHLYAIVLLSRKTMAFDNGTKVVLASYSSFIASYMSLFENQRLQAERDQLFAQQKRIEKSMMQQDKLAAIGQLAAGVAHELNNPLGFIYSNLNTFKVYMQKVKLFAENACATSPALKRLADEQNLAFVIEDTFELIEESLTGARRSRDIISNLRTFSHPDDTSVAKVNLLELLESTLRIANTQIKRNAKLTLTKEIDTAFVNGNATQLSQVLLNLINNASQAIKHQHGVIAVSIKRIQRWLTVKVVDNGCGIDQEALSHIFEPFFTTKDVGHGTGLGLSISQAIIEQHSGCLALEQTSAEGSVFVISLPDAETGSK